MFKRTKVCTAALVALGGAMLTTAALAQTAERIEITGSRIKSINGESTSPVMSVSEERIKETQPVAVEEVIRTLPAAVPAIGPGTNNGTGGGATIDLRGLGSNRTLVLINGRRMVPFDLNGVVDTNSVPIALLRRVDVFTGGASAVYGADAVAGVVNFVLKRDFQGVELNTSYGVSDKGDTKRRRADFTIGTSLADGRGNVALSVGTVKTDALLQGARKFGISSLSSTSGNPSGSFTTVPAFFDSSQVSFQVDPATGAPSDGVETFNFNPLNFFQTPLNRQQATALASFNINDHAQVYSEFMYSRSTVVSNLAPSGTFFNTFSIPIGNPFIPDGVRQEFCRGYSIAAANCVVGDPTEISVDIGRRLVELGPRINDFKNKTAQITVGLTGSIAGSWSYDTYLSRGEADQVQVRGNWGSSSKTQQALRALSTTDCIDPSNGCVPLNLFGAAGSITPEQLKFINLSALLTQSVKQDIVSASVTGDLGSFRSPFARQAIGLAFGAEHRKMTAGNLSDAASQINGEVFGTGAPSPDVNGVFKLNEIYGEASIPLVTDAPFIRSLSLDLGLRHSAFKTDSTTNYNSWKAGGNWEPVKGFRVRAMHQRATRAPNISELFNPVVTGLDNLAVDPCQGANINVADAAVAGTLSNLCTLTGVPLARVGTLPEPSAGQVNVLSGGNPALTPEQANTNTIGFVFEPAVVPGLTVSLDYYRIAISKAVSTPAVDDILDGCYSPLVNPGLTLNASCAAIGRGPGGTFNGSSAPGIALSLSNLGRQAVAGIDLAVGYRLPLKNLGLNPAMGVVNAELNVNRATTYRFQATPASVNRDCLGFFSVACGAPNYEAKFSQRTTWNLEDLALAYNWRHLSGVSEEPGGGDFLPAFSKIKSFDYFDLSATYSVLKNLRLSLSIVNAFNKKPPVVGNTISTTTANSGNTFPQNYDVVGRHYTFGATLNF